MVDLIKKSWDDITIADYYVIQDILNSNEETFNKQVQLLSFLTQTVEDEILNLNIEDFSELYQKTLFINNFDFKKDKEPKKIKFNGVTYLTNLDLQKYTISQYVAYENAIKKQPLKFEELLSTLLVPENKKYGDGYDVLEFQEQLKKDFKFVDCQSILYFFGKRSLLFLNSSLMKSKTMLLMMEKETKDKTLKNKIQETLNKIAKWLG